MSDAAPPGEPPAPEPAADPHGYAALPRWARIAIPVGAVLLVALAVLGWQLASGGTDAGTIEDALEELAEDEQTAPETSDVPVTSTTEVPATTEAPPTTEEAATTTEETAATTTEETATETSAAPVTSATEAPPTTEAPATTDAPAITESPTTEAPTTSETPTPTTEAPTTTEPPNTSEPPAVAEPPETTKSPPTTVEDTTSTVDAAPPTTAAAAPPQRPVAPGAIAANARAFARSWNSNAAATDVPELTSGEVEAQENGPYATTFIAPLSEEVGLVGVVRNDDESVAEALLVWIPGGDEAASNQLYRDAFDVLVRTANPDLTSDDRAELASELGLSPQAPPFPRGEAAIAEAFPQRYRRYVRATSASDDTAIISVVDARPR